MQLQVNESLVLSMFELEKSASQIQSSTVATALRNAGEMSQVLGRGC